MKILIGYDGSEYSDLAIEDLKKAGLPGEAEAVVLSVGEAWNLPTDVERASAGSGKFVFPTTRLIEKRLAEISEASRKLAEQAAARIREMFPGWMVSAEAACGKAAGELIKKADEWSPDLLVVGSQGRSTLGRVFLGSVSHKILHEARCSVRISRRDEAGEVSGVKILVAVDGSENAEAAVETVAGRNWAENAEIRLIAVDDPFSRLEVGYVNWDLEKDEPEDSEKSREWIAKVIDAPKQILESAGLKVSHNIQWGDAANMILSEAEEWKADCIFVGARGLGRVKRFLLGSVSTAVAARAGCSVEVVR